MVEFGDTRVLCTVSLMDSVPRFLKNSGKGWLTAEYGMLPRSTHERMDREASRGKQGGRTLEIQRLIGRSLRNCLDLNGVGERTIYVDCDVIQADGGTRTAAITGSCVALALACRKCVKQGMFKNNPFLRYVASVSVGICNGEVLLDLDYLEDSSAQTDMNVVMNDACELIEIQGTAETKPFTKAQLATMLEVAESGIQQLLSIQRELLA